MIDITGNADRRQPILELAILDRVNRQAGEEPMYLPYINEDGSVPNGLQMQPDMLPALERLGVKVENRVSIQTYQRCLSWNVVNLVQYISPTPCLMVTPEFDMSSPTKTQLDCYNHIKEPKELDILKGKGHIDWIFGDLEGVLKRQLDFLKRRLDF